MAETAENDIFVLKFAIDDSVLNDQKPSKKNLVKEERQKAHIWKQKEIKILINIVGLNLRITTIPPWHQISCLVSSRTKTLVTPKQCAWKWRTLKNKYNIMKLKDNSDKEKWIYYNQINKILSKNFEFTEPTRETKTSLNARKINVINIDKFKLAFRNRCTCKHM